MKRIGTHGLTRLWTLSLSLMAVAAAAHAQWTIDYSVRYEAAGQQLGKFGRVEHLRTRIALIPLGPASAGSNNHSIGGST